MDTGRFFETRRCDRVLNQSLIRAADLIPEAEIEPVITFEFGVVEIVMAGGNDVTTPPSFDPTIRIDFPARVIEHGVNRHNHEQRQRRADMDRYKERHDGEQPSRAHSFYRVKGKARPRGRLDRAVMAFMGPFKELTVMHDTVRKVEPCVLGLSLIHISEPTRPY